MHSHTCLSPSASLTRFPFPSLRVLVLQSPLVQLPLMLLPLKTNAGNCRSLTVTQRTLISSMNASELAHGLLRITTLKGLSLFSPSNCLFWSYSVFSFITASKHYAWPKLLLFELSALTAGWRISRWLPDTKTALLLINVISWCPSVDGSRQVSVTGMSR